MLCYSTTNVDMVTCQCCFIDRQPSLTLDTAQQGVILSITVSIISYYVEYHRVNSERFMQNRIGSLDIMSTGLSIIFSMMIKETHRKLTAKSPQCYQL